MVAVPEGLPLAISLAMALSIKNLKDDQILIKNMEAVQTCAMFNDLCVGKTGTITTGNLNVKKFQMGNMVSSIIDQEQWFKNDWYKNDCGPRSMKELKDLIVQSIVALTDCRLEPNENAIYERKGSPFEVGMIKFLMDKDCKANESGAFGHGDDVPHMMKYVNDIRPKV